MLHLYVFCSKFVYISLIHDSKDTKDTKSFKPFVSLLDTKAMRYEIVIPFTLYNTLIYASYFSYCISLCI